MVQPDLKLISRLVRQHRNEVSCLTAGEHADARQSASAVDISSGDVMRVLTAIADLCLEKGWDLHALSPPPHLQLRLGGRAEADPGRA